ncbi:MAG: dephospho-CoA kinase [Ignavibacteriae bacterium]|nr:dephospho-CoA kinase [Ignavibacteriota bacterium]
MTKHTGHIARIGVTGGIGSGKSAVCAAFERLGVPVLYADAIAREISDTNAEVKRKIREVFGVDSYSRDGKLNRQYVASRVFTDKKLQKKLNALVHPKVREELEMRIGRVPLSSPFVVVEAALIYEAGLDKMLDVVIVVDAEEDIRIRRVVERDGAEPEDVRRRIAAQWSQEKKRSRADIVIRNNGKLFELESQVQFLYTLFVQRYRKA